jgi:hypothetical protein
MKRWKLGLFASLMMMGSTACQTTPLDESETTQLLEDVCSVPNPTFSPWDGSQPPNSGFGKILMMYAPVNGYSKVALVDYQNNTIPYARQVHVGKRAGFIAMASVDLTGYIVLGGGPPPPPDVIGPTLMAQARRYSLVRTQAAGDVAACGPMGGGGGPIKGF